MDELERRLKIMLDRATAHVDPEAARLRNPADTAPRRTARFGLGRLHPAVLVAASSLAVAGVVVGVAAGVPRLDRQNPSTDPSPVATDGTNPLWPLTVSDAKPLSFGQLSAGRAADLPVPYTLDPGLAPDVATEPTLVTAAGPVGFNSRTTKAVQLLAQRSQGTFVGLTGPGTTDADGLHDVRIVLVAPDNTRRDIYRATRAGSVTVSPDGALIAVSTWLGKEAPGVEPAAELVDVATGKVTRRLPGRFTQIAWASDHAVLLTGTAQEPTGLAWRAPWTGGGEPVDVRGGAISVDGGLVAIDETAGCLQRLDPDARLVAAHCDNWRFLGNASPDGRYVAVEWGSGDAPRRHGVLDVRRNEVRTWPADGKNPSWLTGSDVLLTENAEDSSVTARCDLTVGTCTTLPENAQDGPWRAATWIGRF
ncbi:hypothetical protein [Micromonospora sp. NPDC049282]|uniref:hypothetical protein n=1 Tax=Micromonospora sp. NPDC049282 TaxID=3364269 RepID=UPI0037174E46